MSSLIRDFRMAMRARLAEEVEAIELEDIVVERKHSLNEQLDETVAKATNGLVVTVGPGKGTNLSPETGLDLSRVYTVTLWVLPIYRHGEFPEDDIFLPMMKALTLWGDTCRFRTEILGDDDVPDPQYLAQSFQVRKRHLIL